MSTPTVVGSTDTANVIPAGAVTPNYSSGVVPSSYSAVPATPATLPWYQTLTDKREHDFGTVARASTHELWLYQADDFDSARKTRANRSSSS